MVAAAATIGTLIGIASIVIPLVFVATTRTTSVDSVQIDTQQASGEGAGLGASGSALEVVDPGLAPKALGAGVDDSRVDGFEEFVISVDAPWAELWAMIDPNFPGCVTPDQMEWLRTHGTVIPPHDLTMQISNTASSGSEVTVRDIRAQGSLTPPPGDTVAVSWYTCSGAGVDGIYAHMTVGVDPVALYDACYAQYEDSCYFSSGVAPTPGDPVVFGIRPGETRTLNLSYDQTVDFVGRFVATVEVDGEIATIDLSPGAADIVAPMVTRPQQHLRVSSALDGMACTENRDDPAVWLEGCTLERWLEILETGR
jgi:hypothetical protein